MGESMKRYTVRYERDEGGWWVATVVRFRGCHTQGRSLDEARRRIREALTLYIDDADSVELRDEIKLPKDVQKMLRRWPIIGTMWKGFKNKAQEHSRKQSNNSANA